MEKTAKLHMNPYLAGFLLGLILLATFLITGRGLGASGAAKSVVVATVSEIAPTHAASTEYYQNELAGGRRPMKAWLVFQVLGVIFGGFLSGLLSNRLVFRVERGPRIRNYTRLSFALLGGILFGIGSQLGRGCTSGSALSGMAVLSSAGFISMMAIFGTGYVAAYFFRRLWI